MTVPFRLPPLDEQMQVELRQCYQQTHDAKTRTRYQMLLLALDGLTSPQIAHARLSQPGHGGSCAQTICPRRARGRSSAHSSRSTAHDHDGVGSGVASSD
jgi:hypothetical protein